MSALRTASTREKALNRNAQRTAVTRVSGSASVRAAPSTASTLLVNGVRRAIHQRRIWRRVSTPRAENVAASACAGAATSSSRVWPVSRSWLNRIRRPSAWAKAANIGSPRTGPSSIQSRRKPAAARSAVRSSKLCLLSELSDIVVQPLGDLGERRLVEPMEQDLAQPAQVAPVEQLILQFVGKDRNRI